MKKRRPRISEETISRIRELRYTMRAGRLLPIREVASRVGVSPTTVQGVLNCHKGKSVTVSEVSPDPLEILEDLDYLLIFGAIAVGAKTSTDIAEMTQRPHSTTWKRLDRLQELGLLTRRRSSWGRENHITYIWDIPERTTEDFRAKIVASLQRLTAENARDPKTYGAFQVAIRTVREAA